MLNKKEENGINPLKLSSGEPERCLDTTMLRDVRLMRNQIKMWRSPHFWFVKQKQRNVFLQMKALKKYISIVWNHYNCLIIFIVKRRGDLPMPERCQQDDSM